MDVSPNSESRILVIGASSDIGHVLAHQLSQYNVFLGLHYCHDVTRLQKIKDSQPKAKIELLQGSVVNERESKVLVNEFVKRAGGIDVLIQLSGTISAGPWTELNQESWDRDIAINLTGPFFLAQEAMKHMDSGGRIILTSTASASHGGGSNSMAYGVAKAGVECLVQGLARVGAQSNVLVNAVAPGFIMTAKRQKLPKETIDKRASLVALKRPGTVDDIVAMYIFLLSEKSNFITGEVLTVSGGDWL